MPPPSAWTLVSKMFGQETCVPPTSKTRNTNPYMKGKTIGLPFFATLFLAALSWTGWKVLDYSELNPPTPLPTTLTGEPKVIFGFHLALWMVVGMASNYLWDLFRSGKSWQDVTFRGLFMPVLISPIVFFSIWSMWKGDPISFTLPLIAFQNGFFWQVVFSKAGAVDSPPTRS